MKPAVLLVLLCLGCGGETVDPLVASFPLGPRQAAIALAERFPDQVDVPGAFWKGDAQQVDVVTVQSVILQLGERAAAFAEREVRPWPATVSTDLSNGPFVKLELLVGPADATGLDDERVVAVADGEVPRRAGGLALLVWREDGADTFAKALAGGLEGQAGATSFALFVRATASLELSVGSPVPDFDGEATVTIDMPLRSYP